MTGNMKFTLDILRPVVFEIYTRYFSCKNGKTKNLRCPFSTKPQLWDHRVLFFGFNEHRFSSALRQLI